MCLHPLNYMKPGSSIKNSKCILNIHTSAMISVAIFHRIYSPGQVGAWKHGLKIKVGGVPES